MVQAGDQASTVVQDRPPSDTPPTGCFTIIVIDGPDRGASFTIDRLHPTRVLLGHGPACGVRLVDPEVSRRHLTLETVDRGLRVTDLGSTNGTFVDRVRILDAVLEGEEVVRVGATVLRVERATANDEPLPARVSFGRLLGASFEMRKLYPLCAKLAASDVPVVIEGETGTGKEVLAESLHEEGPRAGAPFVVFDCTAVPPNLVESELFGHERGAFTGAHAMRKGIFEQAHGGTLLIDEIGDLDLAMQPKLLRALERSEVRRVGGDRWMRVDVRVIAATRRDLDHEVASGRFRDDLFHRLAVGRIELPPLRRRRGDMQLLAERFCRDLGGEPRRLPGDLFGRWNDYAWPGNVRELRNAVARALALGELAGAHAAAPSAPGDADQAADPVETLLSRRLPFIEARDQLVEEFQHRYVLRVLEENGNDVARAATASGIGRRYFQKLRARYR
jgi:DNA-binding NtrC family response regulator